MKQENDDLKGLEDALNNMPPRGSLSIGSARFALCQHPESVIVNEDMWTELFSYAPPLDITNLGIGEYEIKSVDGKLKAKFILESEWRVGDPKQNLKKIYLKADIDRIREMQTPDGIEPALVEEMPADIRFYLL